jgi:hypothetical protein
MGFFIVIFHYRKGQFERLEPGPCLSPGNMRELALCTTMGVQCCEQAPIRLSPDVIHAIVAHYIDYPGNTLLF